SHTSSYSTNNIISIDGVDYNFSQYSATQQRQILSFESPLLGSGGHTVTMTNGENKYMSLDAIDILHVNKILISCTKNEVETYKKYNILTSLWEDVAISSNTPTEQDYIDFGMEKSDVELVPELAWRELDGYKLSILEYTDNPSQVESIIETETEPYTI